MKRAFLNRGSSPRQPRTAPSARGKAAGLSVETLAGQEGWIPVRDHGTLGDKDSLGKHMMRNNTPNQPQRRVPRLGEPRLTTAQGVLYQADCLDLLAALRHESVDCVFADPPFNLQKDYKNGFNDSKEEADYLAWSNLWIDKCCRVLAPGGALFIYALPKLAFKFAAHLDGLMTFRHWIALTMKGTFPRGRRLYPAHYALLYFTKGEPRVFNKIRTPVRKCRACDEELKDYGGYRNLIHPEGTSLSDFWDDTSPNRHRNSKARPGVNELKPLIPARAIEMSTGPADIVLDPFGGGGSTFQEAQRLGRFWIGSEIGDCAAIEHRLSGLSQATLGKKPPPKVMAALASARPSQSQRRSAIARNL